MRCKHWAERQRATSRSQQTVGGVNTLPNSLFNSAHLHNTVPEFVNLKVSALWIDARIWVAVERRRVHQVGKGAHQQKLQVNWWNMTMKQATLKIDQHSKWGKSVQCTADIYNLLLLFHLNVLYLLHNSKLWWTHSVQHGSISAPTKRSSADLWIDCLHVLIIRQTERLPQSEQVSLW